MSPCHAMSRPCSVPGHDKLSFKYPYEASKPRTLHSSVEKLIAEFVQAMSDLISRYRRMTSYDSQQLGQEVRDLANCFTEQVAARAEAMASQSPLLVEKQAYSKCAGHAPQLP